MDINRFTEKSQEALQAAQRSGGFAGHLHTQQKHGDQVLADTLHDNVSL